MKKRRLRENSVLAFAGDGASKASALIVIAIGARLLSVSEFALLATGLAAAGVLAAVLDLGSGMLLTRDGARDVPNRRSLFTALLRARVPIAVVLLLVAPLVGLVLGAPLGALAVALLAVASALSLSVLGLYRSFQNIGPEAIQRIAAAVLAVAAATLSAHWAGRADAVIAALAIAAFLTLLPLIWLAPRMANDGEHVKSTAALRRAAPIGLLTLATVAYYRSGTLMLAAFGSPKATAAFGIAASVAFGMLMLPNAITTALLPELAGAGDSHGLISCARRALAWTLVISILLSAVAAVVVPFALPLILGSAYSSAGIPFAVLCLGVPLIATSGVIGTTLLSVGALRPLRIQVSASLGVNLLGLALLVPALGAVGAASATVACELIGLILLAHAARTRLPGFLALHPRLRRRIPRAVTT